MRTRFSSACGVAGGVSTLLESRRTVGTGHYHHYLNKTRVEQTEGTDTVLQTHADTQMWLNTQQWGGYSDTYLKHWMQYQPPVQNSRTFEYRNFELDHMMKIVYQYYGAASDLLVEIEDDPLDPHFHRKLEKAKKFGEQFATEIDKKYAELHPTVKILYDAWCARRYMQLQDWYVLVERKREKIFEKISPEWIEKQAKMKGVAKYHMDRLQQLGQDLERDPTMFLETSAFSEKEVEMLKQKMRYFRHIKQYGKAQMSGDLHPS